MTCRIFGYVFTHQKCYEFLWSTKIKNYTGLNDTTKVQDLIYGLYWLLLPVNIVGYFPAFYSLHINLHIDLAVFLSQSLFLLAVDKASLVFLIVYDACFRSIDEIGTDQKMMCLIELKSLAFKKWLFIVIFVQIWLNADFRPTEKCGTLSCDLRGNVTRQHNLYFNTKL